MSVSKGELKCYEYVAACKDIISYSFKGIRGLDKIRQQAHDELCELFELDKEATLKYTDNLDLEDYKCAEKLYFNLRAISRDSDA